MDVKKRLLDLMARAERTTFENERDICLIKIKALLAQHAISDINAFIREQEEEYVFPIAEIRNIFVRQFYPYYCEDAVIDIIDNVPVTFDKYDLERLKSRCDVEVKQFAKDAPSLADVYGTFLGFVERKLEELKRKHNVIIHSFDDFIIVPREIAYWINDKVSGFDTKPGTIKEVCQQRVKTFLERKERFFDDLNHGYYDSDIRRVIDIKALPSSEKVSYSTSETASIADCIRAKPRSDTVKKPNKKKPKTNWYASIHNN